MRVVYVLSQNSGGLPHYAAELANAVGQYADVIVLKPSETTADNVFSNDIEVIDLFDPMNISMPDLRRLNLNVVDNAKALSTYRWLNTLERLDPDVVHDPTGFFPQVRFFAGRYGLDERYPLVVTYHEIPPDGFSPSEIFNNIEQLFTTAIYPLMDRLLPNVHIEYGIVHGDTQKRALDRVDSAPDAIDVIPHGAYEFFKDYDYAEQPEETHSLLFFGNVIPAKGIDTLVEAIPIVSEDLPDVTLIIAGKGRLSKRSQSIITNHSRNFEVYNDFVPNDEVGTFFSRAELVVLPYQYHGGETKGHSGVLSTAYSFGKPVVATTVGEFPSLVEQVGCGVVVPPGDPVALADGIIEALSNDERRERMAERSSEQAKRLSWDNVAEKHLQTYEAAVSSHQARTSTLNQH
jgi:glycosyltransferase involved in cell wall biosynthesis